MRATRIVPRRVLVRVHVLVRVLVLAVLLAGCAHVHPWDRETLAAPGMQAPPFAPIARETAHVVSVREASRGGSGAVGGGCGCN